MKDFATNGIVQRFSFVPSLGRARPIALSPFPIAPMEARTTKADIVTITLSLHVSGSLSFALDVGIMSVLFFPFGGSLLGREFVLKM